MMVFVGHLTQRLFSTEWPDLTNYGIAAVGVFFVLSGFVIQYTRSRYVDLADYATARLVRMWSVVIPALAFTAVADLISYSTNPIVYAMWTHSVASNGVSLIADILFLNQSWGHQLSFGSNAPIWSLGYEAAYYALFGAFVFLRGWWRIAIIAAVAALKGPQILVLFPVWLLGVFTCAVVVSGRNRVAALVATSTLAAALWFSRHQNLDQLLDWIPGGRGPHNNLWMMLTAGLATSSLIFLAELTKPYWRSVALASEGVIRWLAGSTFSIYMFHFPTLILVQAVTRYPRSDSLVKLAVFAGVLGFCVAVSFVTERRKAWWNRPVRWVIGRFAILSPAVRRSAG